MRGNTTPGIFFLIYKNYLILTKVVLGVNILHFYRFGGKTQSSVAFKGNFFYDYLLQVCHI